MMMCAIVTAVECSSKGIRLLFSLCGQLAETLENRLRCVLLQTRPKSVRLQKQSTERNAASYITDSLVLRTKLVVC